MDSKLWLSHGARVIKPDGTVVSILDRHPDPYLALLYSGYKPEQRFGLKPSDRVMFIDAVSGKKVRRSTRRRNKPSDRVIFVDKAWRKYKEKLKDAFDANEKPGGKKLKKLGGTMTRQSARLGAEKRNLDEV